MTVEPAHTDLDFFDLARQLNLLDEVQATELAGRCTDTGTSPGQVAQQAGLLDASQVDVIETLLHPTETIPGYEITRVIGRGGMGVVYRARQLNLDREVALKTILVSRMADRTAAGRFEQEAQTVGRLRHPNIIAAFDFGRHEGRLFLAMEFVDGEDAEAFIKRVGPLNERTAWGIARQIASGLAHAAAQGIVHRDIKPANLLLIEAPEGTPLPAGVPMVKIADFGLAFLTDETLAQTRLTSQTSTVGSPHYMAPEQLTGEPIDFRTDMYALGATVYHLLSGRPPFAGLNLSQVVALKLTGDPKPLSEVAPRTSSVSCRLVERMMARNPLERFETYADLLTAIDALSSVTTRTEKMPAVGVEVGGEGTESFPIRPADTASTQTVPVAGDETYSFETSLVQREKPWWRRLNPLILVSILSMLFLAGGLYWIQFRHGQRITRPAMTSTGWSTQLFYGTSTTGWQNLSGNWVTATDAEGGNVLAGENGAIARPLFLRKDAEGQLVAPPFYHVQFFVEPHRANAVGIHFALKREDGRDGPRHVVRLTDSKITLGTQQSDGGAFEESAEPVPMLQPWAGRHRVDLERLPTGWFVSVDGQELPPVPLRTDGELPEFRLTVLDGPAWFSDLLLEELSLPGKRGTSVPR